MIKFSLIISVLVLYNINNVYCKTKTCENFNDCMIIPLCSEAAKLAPYRKNNESIKRQFTSSICGTTLVANHRTVQICCSDFEEQEIEFVSIKSNPTLARRTADAEPDSDDLSNHSSVGLLPEHCGKYLEDRIVGGEFAHIYQFPWMVLISFIGKLPDGTSTFDFGCGGTIINSKYILTAAHCVQAKVIGGVRLGEYDISTTVDCEGEYPTFVCEDHLQDLRIEKSIVHNDFHMTRELENDIALLRVQGEIDFAFQNIAPVCLPVYEQLINSKLNGKMVTIAGWGITETGNRSMKIKKVSVRVWSDAKPNENIKYILAGNAGSDSCQGDSGGPLMLISEYNGTERMIQYGIVSNGPVLCGSSSPAKYTDTRKYMRWILDNIEE